MCRNGSDAVEMNHLAGGVHSGIGAARSEAVNGPVRIELLDRVLQNGLDAEAVPLPLPAAEFRSVVLQAESDPVGDRLIRHCRRRFRQTSSMMAISALSPRRRTVRVMRV